MQGDTEVSSPTWQVGQVLDGVFEMKALIGRGGMGTVYRVYHREWDLDLAIKVPQADQVEDPVNKERFLREAQTWIDLGVHPNIVQCWFVREICGLPVLFLDYLAGGSLRHWRLEGYIQPGEWEKILDLMIQAADGLAHAHEHGVVHRDVKPANLLIRGDDRLCVTDFGLVKVGVAEEIGAQRALDSRVGEPTGEDTTLTVTGSLLGTPEYGAPEQWGQARHVGPSADIYGLGVVLYELCCGRRPFDDGFQKVPPQILVGRHLSKEPPHPRAFQPDVPEGLCEVILACLSKDPDERPESMAHLREWLSRIYQDLVGRPYPRPVPRAGVQRADALNNKAVSLWNLGKSGAAFDAWDRAIRLDAAHPETVYNRTLVEWRLGRIEERESLRRLNQLKSSHPRAGAYLGFFHLERLAPEEAERELSEALKLPEAREDGSFWRALGDAWMYQEQFDRAEQAYRQALARQPADPDTLLRLQLAASSSRSRGERILFPRSRSRSNLGRMGPVHSLTLSPEGKFCLSAGPAGVEKWHVQTGFIAWSWKADASFSAGPLRADGKALVEMDTPGGCAWSLEDGRCLGCLDGDEAFLALVPGGGAALSGTRDIHLRELPDGSVRQTFSGHGQPVTGAVVFPDGDRFVSADAAGQIRLWCLEGRCLSIFRAAVRIERLALVDGGMFMLVADANGVLTLWDVLTGEVIRKLPSLGPVRRITALLRGNRILVETVHAEQGEHFHLLDLTAGTVLYSRRCANLQLTPDEKYAVGIRDRELRLWEITTGRRLRTLQGHRMPVKDLAITPDGLHAISGSLDGTTRVWELDEDSRIFVRTLVVTRTQTHTEGELVGERYRQHVERARELLSQGEAPAAYRQLVLARHVPGYRRDPDVLSMQAQLQRRLPRRSVSAVLELCHLNEPSGEPTDAVALSADASWAVTAAGRKISLWDLSSGKWVRELVGHRREVRAVHMTPDGRVAVSGAAEDKIMVWDLKTGHCLHALPGHAGGVAGVGISQDCHTAAAVTWSGELFLWDLRKGALLRKVQGPAAPTSVAISADCRYVLVGAREAPRLSLWDLSQDRCIRKDFRLPPELAEQPVPTAVALSGDARLALIAGHDFALSLWELRGGTCLRRLEGHAERVSRLALAADFRHAVSASFDGTFRMWDLQAGAAVDVQHGHDGPVIDVTLTAEARFCLSTGGAPTSRLWEYDWELDSADSAEQRKDGIFDRLTSLFRRK